jgi:hypothetical protein
MKSNKFIKAKVCRIPSYGDAYSFPKDIRIVVDVNVSDEIIINHARSLAIGNYYRRMAKVVIEKMKIVDFEKQKVILPKAF